MIVLSSSGVELLTKTATERSELWTVMVAVSELLFGNELAAPRSRRTPYP